jgi:hypothetical protein
MGHVTLTVGEIKWPAEGKARGNIIAADGRKFGCFREKFGLFQVGGTYDVEISDGQYQNVVSAKPVAAASPQDQQAATAPAASSNGHGNGNYRPTDPTDAKRIFVCANLTAMIRAGKVENTKESVWATTQLLCQVYDHTFGSNIFRASEAGSSKPRLVAAE